MKAARIALLLLALAGMLLTAALGRWQLSRAAEKRLLQQAWQTAAQQADAGSDALAQARGQEPGHWLYRHVQLRGHWLAQHTVYLDNRSMDGRTGFYVLTPLQLEAGQGTALVLRGWAPRDFQERSRLPQVDTTPALVQVRGQLIEHIPRVYELGQDSTGPIRQNLEVQAFAGELGLALYPLVVQQVGPASDGLQRDWPEPASGLERHQGYALQWFGLCALMGVLFIWFQLVRPRQHASTKRQPSA